MVTQRTQRLLLAALLALLAAAAPARAQVAPGGRFPALSGFNLPGAAIPETAGRVVMIDFWASWCAPCKASFPAYNRLQARLGDKGLVIIAVSVDDNPAAYASFIARLKPAFATVDDRSHALVEAVQVPTMPTCYILDRRGVVRFVHAGFRGEETEREIGAQVESLLAEGRGAP
jgi:thiol-disulfide isomerase/thioredoxin